MTPSILTGLGSADAERVWSALIERGGTRGRRPVVLLNPFGGAKRAKGFVGQHRQLLSAEIAGLVDEGYLVVLLPNGMPWGGRRAIAEVLSRLDPAVRAMVRVAPDPADPREAARLRLRERPALAPADRVMRLFKYFAVYADLVVTIEGWMTHLAYSLGRPFRLYLAAQSHSFDWHPRGRGPEQRLVPTLSARSTAQYSASGLLGESDPPPLPHRPRKGLLRLALAGVRRAGGLDGLALVRRAGASQDHEVRAFAIAALGRARPIKTVLRDLLAALEDREPAVVREAADILLRERVDCSRELGPRYRDRILAHALVCRQDWRAVQRLGAVALPALFRAAESDNDVVRREARIALRRALRSRLSPLSSDSRPMTGRAPAASTRARDGRRAPA